MYYIGLDVHKQKISYCIKDSSGRIHSEGWTPTTHYDVDCWMQNLPQAVERGNVSHHVLRLDLRANRIVEL